MPGLESCPLLAVEPPDGWLRFEDTSAIPSQCMECARTALRHYNPRALTVYPQKDEFWEDGCLDFFAERTRSTYSYEMRFRPGYPTEVRVDHGTAYESDNDMIGWEHTFTEVTSFFCKLVDQPVQLELF